MNSETRQFERHMEEVNRTHAEATSRNNSGIIAHAMDQSRFEDDLGSRMDDALFGDMEQTEAQDVLHEFGGGISKGPPPGGWPQFDPVTGERLAHGAALSVISPHSNGRSR